MKRAVPVVVATAGGLALLANFKTTPWTPAVRTSAAPSTVPPSSTTPTTAGPTSTIPRPTTSTTAAARRAINGPDVVTRYGDVQGRVVVSGRHLDDVEALVLPTDRERSAEISDYAGPELRQEALQAQSANIDLVSGATYTSEGYIRSLQGAIDAIR